MNALKKETLIQLLEDWIKQRAGLEFGNYGDVSSYRAEQRSITKDRHDAERLLNSVRNIEEITAEDIIKASNSAYSGRLQFVQNERGSWEIQYCKGQCFPTEYRAAVCAVLASALWDDARNDICEEVENKGDYLRKHFQHWFGRGIASRWFN